MAVSWALISGASTGIGRATTLALLSRGINVIAGVRSEAAANRLTEQASAIKNARLEITELDVTDQSAIDSTVSHASQLAGSDGLRVVINNAGIVVPGPVEHVTAAEWRRQFDVNFFGAIELTRATLPLLRQAVAAHGRGVPRLLLISSIGGRIAQPVMAPYTTSKFALTALGDSLRLELRRQGIGVTALDRRTASNAIPVERAAEQVVRAILAPKTSARVLIGTDAKVMASLKSLLPTGVFDNILAKEFGIPKQ